MSAETAALVLIVVQVAALAIHLSPSLVFGKES